MKRALLKALFDRDLSTAHAIGGIGTTLALMHGRYGLAAIVFAAALVVSVIGERALEKSA